MAPICQFPPYMKVINSKETKHRKIAAVGMYDGVHRGHQFLINYLKLEALHRGLHPAVVTFEEHPRTLVRPLEAPGMLTILPDRLRLLNSTGLDFCILLKFDDKMRRFAAKKFLGMLHDKYGVDALVVGFNNRFGRDRVEGLEQYRAIGREIGMDILSAPEYKGDKKHVSSSIVREYLFNGEVSKACDALGRPFRMRGRVVDGKRLGRTMGFPTANLKPHSDRQLIPRVGVYAVVITTPDGIKRPAMLNIGYRPTVDDSEDAKLTIEVNILNYSGFLYGEDLTVDFIDFIRNEKKFSSMSKLKSQLESDAKKVRKVIEKFLSPAKK